MKIKMIKNSLILFLNQPFDVLWQSEVVIMYSCSSYHFGFQISIYFNTFLLPVMKIRRVELWS